MTEDNKENVDKDTRSCEATPVTNFLDSVQDIFLKDVTGVKNIGDCDNGSVEDNLGDDLMDLALELEQIGFKTPSQSRRDIETLPGQVSGTEKVKSYLNNLEASEVSDNSVYHSTPKGRDKLKAVSPNSLKPPDFSLSTVNGSSF